MAISPEPLIVDRQNWGQNARKNRLPIRDVEQPILYQFVIQAVIVIQTCLPPVSSYDFLSLFPF